VVAAEGSLTEDEEQQRWELVGDREHRQKAGHAVEPEEEEKDGKQWMAKAADACGSSRGRQRTVAYIEGVLERLDRLDDRCPSSARKLRGGIMPTVVASLQGLVSSAPASVRDSMKAHFIKHCVLPSYEADCDLFRQALRCCLAVAQTYGTQGENEVPVPEQRSMSKGLPPGLGPLQPGSFIIRNTFVDVVAHRGTDGEDEELDLGVRAQSEPTYGASRTDLASAVGALNCPQEESSHAEPIPGNEPDSRKISAETLESRGLDAFNTSDALPSQLRAKGVEYNGRSQAVQSDSHEGDAIVKARTPASIVVNTGASTSASTVGSAVANTDVLSDVSERPAAPASAGQGQRGDEGSKSHQANQAPAFVIRNTFVDIVCTSEEGDRDDDDGGLDLADLRSLSDPTSMGVSRLPLRVKELSSLPFKIPAKEFCASMATGAAEVATAMVKATDADKGAGGFCMADLFETPALVTFTDREGDTTTLRPVNQKSGCLDFSVNGEHYKTVKEIELEHYGNGQYSVFMEGVGAVVVIPTPGPKQHEMCSRLVRLARACGVVIRGREGLALANASSHTEASIAMDYEGLGQSAMIPWQDLGWEDGSFPVVCGDWAFGSFHENGSVEGQMLFADVPLTPNMGREHSFHPEVSKMGSVRDDFREFRKEGFEGRLSVVSESRVHTRGCHRFLVQFTTGELSKADGVGFIFSQKLPCKKNIQRIVSIFVNQRGTICMRVFQDVIRASVHVKTLRCGDWIEMVMDLDNLVANFTVWPQKLDANGRPRQPSRAEFAFAQRISTLCKETCDDQHPDLRTGHLACVVKNVGVTVTLGS